jgi:hypothetical protein
VAKKFKPPATELLSSVGAANCEYSSTLAEVIGVVSLSSQGGWPKCDDYDVHCFELAAWRHAGQPIVNHALTILRAVGNVGESFSDFEMGAVHRIQVLLSEDLTRAIFSKSIDSPADPELEAIAVQLKQPVIVHTERFGPLTLDRRINWFEGSVNWNGQIVSLHIEPDENLDLTNQLQTAETLFANSLEWDANVKKFAVQEKLDLAKDWQEEEITEEDFLARMTLETISIKPEGEFEFWHDDGDLFWGHSIQIWGSLKEGLTGSDIPG